jgi:hypothetical protein
MVSDGLNYSTADENFSDEFFSAALPDDQVRRIPSLLSLFSEQSTEVLADDETLSGGSLGKSPTQTLVPASPHNYSGLFITPKSAASRARLLSAVDESEERLSSIPQRGGFFRSDSLKKLGVSEVDASEYDDVQSDSDDEQRPGDGMTQSGLMAQPAPDPTDSSSALIANNPLLYTTSFVKSMSEYAFRRDIIEQRIDDGELTNLLSPTGTTNPSKRDQVNLAFYTDENQARRRHIKKHPQFIAIARKLWDCVDLLKSEDGNMTRDSYVVMCLKITLLICPPPINAEDCKKHAEEDWESDTKGEDTLTYDRFFISMFELVDTWTESCNAEDYIETLLRLIDGICFNEDGVIHFKEDEKIAFDRFFSFMGDVKPKDLEPRGNFLRKFHVEEDEDAREMAKRPSQLVDVVGPPPGASTKKRRKSDRGSGGGNTGVIILPLPKVLEEIGKLYMEKAKADHWIDSRVEHEDNGEGAAPSDKPGPGRRKSITKKSHMKIRFDAFVLKHFKNLHGTKGIARRHLRNFVVSVQHLSSAHPRVDVFRKLAGIPGLVDDDNEPYISSLVVRYVIPLLHHLFGKADEFGKLINGKDALEAPSQQVIDHVEPSLAGVYFGSRMVANFKTQLAAKCARPKTGTKEVKGKGMAVDVDEAIALAYPLFVYSDSMRAFSHVRAARIIQRWFKTGVWPPYNREKLEEDVVAVAAEGGEEEEAAAMGGEEATGEETGDSTIPLRERADGRGISMIQQSPIRPRGDVRGESILVSASVPEDGEACESATPSARARADGRGESIMVPQQQPRVSESSDASIPAVGGSDGAPAVAMSSPRLKLAESLALDAKINNDGDDAAAADVPAPVDSGR